jgi:glycosyltransferase involved in cell wall biosynthesis
MKILLIIIYAHHEAFPPTLNGIIYLAKKFDKIFIIHKNTLQTDFELPENCFLVCNEEYNSVKDILKLSFKKKISQFIKFSLLVRKIKKKQNPTHVIVYDSVALLCNYLSNILKQREFKLWYHNHDIVETNKVRKFSILWFAGKLEFRAMRQIQLFSLPAQERKQYFSIPATCKYFFIPNYPLREFYQNFLKKENIESEIRLIFQGSIGPNHGIEEIITILNEKIDNCELKLVLKGSIDEDYKNTLITTSQKLGVEKSITFLGFTPYKYVPEVASNCHIGLAIHKGNDVMNRTLGTSSNKIYEYAALGLPVILFDNSHFKEHLDKFKWTFFTDCTKESLLIIITTIKKKYSDYVDSAICDFQKSLNFELVFSEAVNEFL